MGIAVYLSDAGDIFDGVFWYCPFSQDMSEMRTGNLLSPFLRDFLPSFTNVYIP